MILFRCCGSPSFMMNRTRFLSQDGIKFGIACWNTHRKLKRCWFGIHIHKKVTCLSMDVRQEKWSRWKPLLFVCDVTSHQTTSGQSLKNRRVDKIVQAIAIDQTLTPDMAKNIPKDVKGTLNFGVHHWFQKQRMCNANLLLLVSRRSRQIMW